MKTDDNYDFSSDIEKLNSSTIEDTLKTEIANNLLKNGGSKEFISVANLMLSYEPDTRWGRSNPFESLIKQLYEKSLTELHSEPIGEGANHIVALDVISRFNEENYEIATEILNFIFKYINNEKIKFVAVKCLCRILYTNDNPFGIPRIYDFFSTELEHAISGEESPNIKGLIPILTISKDIRAKILIHKLIESTNTKIEIKYYLYKHVYGNFSTDSLKEELLEKCKEFINELWLHHPELHEDAETLENIVTNN